MKALNEEEIQQICKLYREYGNLRGVSLKSSRSLGVVYKYITSNGLIKKQNIVKEICTNDERLIGAYVGLWLGDGTQYVDRYRRTIKICSNKEDKLLNKFIQDIIYRIFKKKTLLIEVFSTKQAYIKFHSKFIFEFISKYVVYDARMKTYTVGLRKRTNSYSKEFREGCLLGLALSDGYLKERFVFHVSSSRLAKNMYDLLAGFGYKPYSYLDKRSKYHNKIMYSVQLIKSESIKINSFLGKIIEDLGYVYSFQELKYGPAQI